MTMGKPGGREGFKADGRGSGEVVMRFDTHDGALLDILAS